MAQITCGNCGGAHDSVAEVRQCHTTVPQTLFSADDLSHSEPGQDEYEPDGQWQPDTISAPLRPTSARTSRPSASAAISGRPGPASGRTARPNVTTAPVRRAVPVLAPPPDGWAGPEALGRWFVTTPDGLVPDAWSEANRYVIDRSVMADPDALLDVLLPRWQGRQRTVIELAVPFIDRPSDIERTLPWDLDPSFVFSAEQLWFTVWANSVDGTGGQPRWAWAELAAASGGGTDGEPHWYDGGPVAVPPAGLSVVHRIGIERGSLTPLSHAACAADLAPDQLAAVAHDGGAARIIAPAGSGKTRVLTERARHLLRDWHLPAGALTLVAFNVRAAEEIRERTTDLANLQIRTLNALALAIVNGSGSFRHRGARLATLDERDVRRILDSLVTLPRKANTDPAQAWIDALSLVRLGLRSPASVEAMFDGDVPGFTEIFGQYRAVLAERGAVDFDEQITAAIIALLTEPDTRATAQQVARVLLVDEFQDLTPAHLLLLRLLASPELAVFGVGDDDQTIYGYAGATPEWLIAFGRLFPGAGDHPLEVNYRCPPAVVTAAATLLTHNRRRVTKQIRPRPERTAEAGALTVVADDDMVSSAIAAVHGRLAAGATTQQIAVLTRVTASLAPVQVALRHAGIAVQSVIDARYLERTGVRTALSWLNIAANAGRLRSSDIDATARRPSRGISPRVLEWMSECRDHAALVKLAGRITNERDSDKVSAYAQDISQVTAKATKGATTFDLLQFVRTRVGLDDALAKLDRSRADAQSTHLDDLDALTALALLHPDHTTFATWLNDELSAPSDPNGVLLSSVHRVKGREWPHVVVYDVCDGIMPHRLADDQAEERRVFHVALTRCSQTVTVLTDAACSSPFLAEMETEAGPEPDRIVRSRSTNGSANGSGSGSANGSANGSGSGSAAPSAGWDGRSVVPARAGGSQRSGASVGSGSAAAAGSRPLAGDGDQAVRTALRLWRGDRARADGVPAYVVFTNVTLDALAELRPTSLDQLKRIPGIGPAKRERYGETIVDIIRAQIPD